jgi:hypothetical protein
MIDERISGSSLQHFAMCAKSCICIVVKFLRVFYVDYIMFDECLMTPADIG